ncbi:hypothetical protein ACFFX0_02885 [Citricoccus parietis]|uniref:Uncharacterized protein n=1 Tax=Citricoccus parietis TaxID=592307 RepID=A0ABV5FU28_9MICC
MAPLDDGALGRVDAAPPGDGLRGDEGFCPDDSGNDSPSPEHRSRCHGAGFCGRHAHDSSPFQVPVIAACTQSAVVPNQASIPRMAGR